MNGFDESVANGEVLQVSLYPNLGLMTFLYACSKDKSDRVLLVKNLSKSGIENLRSVFKQCDY